MPATELQGSFLGRISIRRNQVASMEEEAEDIELFQRNVADRFSDLLPSGSSDDASSPAAAPPSDPLLSIGWLGRLLNVFLCCEAEFKATLIMGRDPSHAVKPPLDRLLPELLDRTLKALDICNAVTHGIEAVRHGQKLAEIAVAALEQRPIGDGQVRRAKKALGSLLILLTLEDKDGSNYKSTERSWSFGRRGGGGGGSNKDRSQYRSVSWGLAKSWSAAKQIQAMSNNLAPPRGAEASGLALPVYTMSTVMLFVMWALVAAIPCQERSGLTTHFPVPKQFAWAQPMVALHEKIGEEWKRKEKKGSAGLMEEMQRIEKLAQSLVEFADSFQFPAEEKRLEEVAAQVGELAETCRKMEEGLVPLQQQIREVFHRMVRSRAEFLDALEQGGKSSAPAM